MGNKVTYDTFKSAKLLSEKVGIITKEEIEVKPSQNTNEVIADELDGQKILF